MDRSQACIAVLAEAFGVGLGAFLGETDEGSGRPEVNGVETLASFQETEWFKERGIGLLGGRDLVPGLSELDFESGILPNGFPKRLLVASFFLYKRLVKEAGLVAGDGLEAVFDPEQVPESDPGFLGSFLAVFVKQGLPAPQVGNGERIVRFIEEAFLFPIHRPFSAGRPPFVFSPRSDIIGDLKESLNEADRSAVRNPAQDYRNYGRGGDPASSAVLGFPSGR